MLPKRIFYPPQPVTPCTSLGLELKSGWRSFDTRCLGDEHQVAEMSVPEAGTTLASLANEVHMGQLTDFLINEMDRTRTFTMRDAITP